MTSRWERATAKAFLDGRRQRTAHGVVPGTKGFVYLVRNTITGNVKIGFTTQVVEQRLRKLQQGSDALLELIGSIASDSCVESHLHHACRVHRLKGEWFEPRGEVLRVIAHFKVERRMLAYMEE